MDSTPLTPRHLRHLREIVGRLEYQASVSENGPNPHLAHKYKDHASTVRAVLRLLEPAIVIEQGPGIVSEQAPANVIEAVITPMLGANGS